MLLTKASLGLMAYFKQIIHSTSIFIWCFDKPIRKAVLHTCKLGEVCGEACKTQLNVINYIHSVDSSQLIPSGLQDSGSQQTHVLEANWNNSMGCCNYTAFLNHFKTLSLTPSYLTLWHCANILEGRTVVVQAALFGAARKQHKATLGGARIPLSISLLIPLQTTFICLSCSTGAFPFTFLSRQQETTGVLVPPGPKIAFYLISPYRQITTSTRELMSFRAQCILSLSQK